MFWGTIIYCSLACSLTCHKFCQKWSRVCSPVGRRVVPHATAKSDGTSASHRTKTHRLSLPYLVHVRTARKLSLWHYTTEHKTATSDFCSESICFCGLTGLGQRCRQSRYTICLRSSKPLLYECVIREADTTNFIKYTGIKKKSTRYLI